MADTLYISNLRDGRARLRTSPVFAVSSVQRPQTRVSQFPRPRRTPFLYRKTFPSFPQDPAEPGGETPSAARFVATLGLRMHTALAVLYDLQSHWHQLQRALQLSCLSACLVSDSQIERQGADIDIPIPMPRRQHIRQPSAKDHW